ncbi:MAG: hypothetical protein FJX40_10030 [Alphaproteobacteria bacterium]|nr:hypothetical protein [Alphaproteobacteria bacterium]MBM3642372.1 hypothetical protein [Alphaproteobacteria bacterium]
MILARIALVLICGLAAGAALAQEAPSSGGEFIGRIFDATGLRTTPPQAADFVRESRPEHMDYRPFDPKPKKDPKRKTAADLRAMGADLEAAAAENRRKAAGVAAPDAPVKPAAR